MPSRRPILFVGLLCGLGLARCAAALSIHDVIHLSESGYAERELVRVLEATDARFELDAKGLVALAEAGVPAAVMNRMLDDGGAPEDEFSKLTALQIGELRDAAVADETILKFARHRNVCEPLSPEDAERLRRQGVDEAFLQALADLVAACVARRPAAPATEAHGQAEVAPARIGAETAHRVIIRDDPYWNAHHHDRHRHSHRHSHWYPIYIYRDHRDHRRHMRDHKRLRDRHRWERRHRGDRPRHQRPRERHERRGRAERRESRRESATTTPVAGRPLRDGEPWVSSHPRPLNREPSRVTRRSAPTAAQPPGANAAAPRPSVGARTRPGPGANASPPRPPALAPGAISALPIKSAAPEARRGPGHSARPAPRDAPRARAPATFRMTQPRATAPAPRKPFDPPRSAPRPAPKPMPPRAPAHDEARAHR